MASGKNGNDGDLLLFQDGLGAYDISVGTLRLFISWECSQPVAEVKVNSSLGSYQRMDVLYALIDYASCNSGGISRG
ncbi:hypothetical protein Tco_0229348, partial [Tanacetum coccineum]